MSSKRKEIKELPMESNPSRKRSSPSFPNMVRDVMTYNSMQNLTTMIERILRPMVSEEVEKAFKKLKYIQRYPSNKRIEAMATTPSLRLIFKESPKSSIFTNAEIKDKKENNLKLSIVDSSGDEIIDSSQLPSHLKIEIVAIDGDFVSDGRETWTKEEFEKHIVKERNNHPSLLNGDVIITMRDGSASLDRLSITDNSSWMRSRYFKIGARVVESSPSSTNLRIQEAITERFKVKDQRGEQYKKNYPPSLEDNVWRLEKIAKDGTFHRRLEDKGIKTVQDFLKLGTVDEEKLRNIMGQSMSDKKWKVTMDHARSCHVGENLYTYHTVDGCCVVVDAICQPRAFFKNGTTPLLPLQVSKETADRWVREVLENWNRTEMVHGTLDQLELQSQLTDGNEEDVTTPLQQEEGLVIPNEEMGFGFNMGLLTGENVDEINNFGQYLLVEQSCTSYELPQVNFGYKTSAGFQAAAAAAAAAIDDKVSSLPYIPRTQSFPTGYGHPYM